VFPNRPLLPKRENIATFAGEQREMARGAFVSNHFPKIGRNRPNGWGSNEKHLMPIRKLHHMICTVGKAFVDDLFFVSCKIAVVSVPAQAASALDNKDSDFP